MTIPKTVDDLSAEWLSDALGRKVEDPKIEPIGVGQGLVGALYRVSFDGECVIAKLAAPDEANRFVPTVLNFYGREIGFYTQLSARTPIQHPKCFYTAHNTETQDMVLLLEDVSARGVCGDQIVGCTLPEVRSAISTLARLHAAFWEDPTLADLPFLLRLRDEPYPSAVTFAYEQAWPVVKELFADMLDDHIVELGDRFGPMLSGLFDALCEGPLTLSHGDWRVDNLFFTPDNDVLAVDWQIIDRSVGPRDVSYLMSQGLNIDDPAGYTVAFEQYVGDLAELGVAVDRAWAWDAYRAGMLMGFVYPVIAGGGLGVDDPRALDLCRAMLRRSVTALDAVDAYDLNY